MRFATLSLLMALLIGCEELQTYRRSSGSPNDTGSSDDTGTPPLDLDTDNDGYTVDDDCDDNDAEVNPSATEVCDDIDNDCDSMVDEDDAADASTWYADDDEDGYGDPSTSLGACGTPSGYVSVDTDCDDQDASVNPGQSEVCNSVDDDCNGEVDDGQQWFLDHDSDGYGDPAYEYLDGCDGSTYLVVDSSDCDDNDAEVNPGATEVCDGIDNDCDSTVDEDDATDASTWYADDDEDGYGDAASSATSCSAPSGTVADNTDCNDHNPVVNPGESEVCDEIDNDCNDDVDEGVTTTYYADTDGDGYGVDWSILEACELPDGYVQGIDMLEDCDPDDASVNPGATEVCNEIDDDCDGDTDEDDAADASTWYADDDGDGYGDADSSSVSCEAPSGFVSDDTDCDDTESDVNPGETEVCNDIDDDCDGDTDAGAADATTWYPDSDGDDFGNPDGVTVTQCDQPSSYVSDATDCDDGDSASYPGATEYCDDADNDCDGDIDPDSAADAPTWYNDVDGDGFGDVDSSSTSCLASFGTVEDATDCDDTDSSIYPDAVEYCNLADDDCDGDTDENVETTFYADSDEDGFGDPSTSLGACGAPSGYVSNDNDCDDTDEDSYPGGTETCDEVDNDCDGNVDEGVENTYFLDGDGDGFGDQMSNVDACEAPSGYVDDLSDCDDTNSSVYLGAEETCDELDNDCDGDVDEDATTMFFEDVDGDGYGDAESTTDACEAPEGFVANADDCDDGNAATYPDAPESCDSEDNDCDDSVDENLFTEWFVDKDGDLYGAGEAVDVICNGSYADLVDNDDDCNDSVASVFPGGTEVCGDDIDQDCNGTDEECPVVDTGSSDSGS